MKSTKVQNPRRILLHVLRASSSSLVNNANARAYAEIGHASLVSVPDPL